MGSKSNEESSFPNVEISKEIDSYFKYLVSKHITLQIEIFTIEDSCYNRWTKKYVISRIKTKIVINIESQQLILELMWFLSHLRDFPGGRANHWEHIYGEIKSSSGEELYKKLKEQYINLNRSEIFIVNDLVKKMEKFEFSTNWLWKILYLMKKDPVLNLPSENQEFKTTDEMSTDIETIISKYENLEKLIYETRQRQEDLIQDMDEIKKDLEDYIF